MGRWECGGGYGRGRVEVRAVRVEASGSVELGLVVVVGRGRVEVRAV
jgi:hypothetical protein